MEEEEEITTYTPQETYAAESTSASVEGSLPEALASTLGHIVGRGLHSSTSDLNLSSLRH
jgi:hypothetical protein